MANYMMVFLYLIVCVVNSIDLDFHAQREKIHLILGTWTLPAQAIEYCITGNSAASQQGSHDEHDERDAGVAHSTARSSETDCEPHSSSRQAPSGEFSSEYSNSSVPKVSMIG